MKQSKQLTLLEFGSYLVKNANMSVLCVSVFCTAHWFFTTWTHTPLCCLTAKTHCFIFLYLTVQQSIKCLLQRNAATHGFPSPPVCSEHLDVQIDVHVERHDLFICLADGALPLTYRLFYLCTSFFHVLFSVCQRSQVGEDSRAAAVRDGRVSCQSPGGAEEAGKSGCTGPPPTEESSALDQGLICLGKDDSVGFTKCFS